ncbi:hypothetical protein HPB50_026209 [Hyalomma asiaticum]|uniref:Uncharacterized protein n=1 Tax=Hyalomma asiaticum TaxID=266040 RepID=A0ACB7S480_HYAAI|nr:hypothetical protein HPB50_026209 [Hyalomma asiaticum]
MSTNVARVVAAVALWLAVFLLWVQPCQARVPPNYVSSRRDDPYFGRAYREVSRWFWRYIDAERSRLDSIRRKLDRLEVAQRSYDGVDPEEYLGLPMNAFLLIKRLARDYIQVLEEAKDNTNAKLLLAMRPGGKRARRYRLPSKKDVSKAALAVLEFQRKGDYSAKEIADGLAVEPDSPLYNFQMTARDCFHLGVAASEAEDGENTKEWMLEALDRAADGTVDTNVVKEYLAYGYFLEGDYRGASEANNQLLEDDPSNMRAFLNMEFYQEGGPGHCYASPATLVEMALFKRLTHPARPDNTCARLLTALRGTYEGDVYREQVVREPTTVVFRNVLSSKETAVLKLVGDADGVVVNTSAYDTLGQVSRRLEEITHLKALGSKIPWKQLVSFCDEHTWLNPGNNLRSKPYATWWLFTGHGVVGGLDRSLLPTVFVDPGTVLLRYHVMTDGMRDREPIPFSCHSGNTAIFYKRIMLEDQRQLCRGPPATRATDTRCDHPEPLLMLSAVLFQLALSGRHRSAAFIGVTLCRLALWEDDVASCVARVVGFGAGADLSTSQLEVRSSQGIPRVARPLRCFLHRGGIIPATEDTDASNAPGCARSFWPMARQSAMTGRPLATAVLAKPRHPRHTRRRAGRPAEMRSGTSRGFGEEEGSSGVAGVCGAPKAGGGRRTSKAAASIKGSRRARFKGDRRRPRALISLLGRPTRQWA